MSTTLTESPLAANLAALSATNADVVEFVQSSTPAEGVSFFESRSGATSATLPGKLGTAEPMASRHDPKREAERLVGGVDVVENAVVVVLGFGLGYHVEALARRMKKVGLIIVYEPDVKLLRAVLERIDHSSWLRESLVVFFTDADDRATIAEKLHGGESILAQGTVFLEHPASRNRLGEHGGRFSATFAEFVKAARTTLVTTLVRSIDTTRNLLRNTDHYVVGPGIIDLEHAAHERLAVVVSAGPSLHKNVHWLADPGVRDRCVIIAVQTSLKPLLQLGIKPHFVTALDYHEISKRFYEGLTPADVEGVTLVVDPKAHPAILDAFPGEVRCCRSAFLDGLLGDEQRDMGALPAGATVAHLAVYLARWLGCNPIALIGQDLGFPDGLYYAPGTAIHDVWAPELNPFNTIAMMEWQRIVRYRVHLNKTVDVHGRSIYTDAQMQTYRQQFERDFAEYAREGVDIIDATEGGVVKQHARTMPLRDVLGQYGGRPGPPLPPAPAPDPARLVPAGTQLARVQQEIVALRRISEGTAELIRRMLADQSSPERMKRHFKKIERNRRQVEERFETFRLLGTLNQLGAFKRMKADRRIEMQTDQDPVARQRAQLERDLENVRWIADAAEEMTEQLDAARRVLRGERVTDRARPAETKPAETLDHRPVTAKRVDTRVAALVPVDPERNALGIERSLTEPIGGVPVLQATLERLGASRSIESIVLIAPDGFDVDSLIDRRRIGRPIEIERARPFGPEREAVAAARLWAATCWRGGIAGMSAYDEALNAREMRSIMESRHLTAAIIAAPDWPFVDATPETGVDALVGRYREHPDRHGIVFTQAPPGLSACLITAGVMRDLCAGTAPASVGGRLGYQPRAPQDDPIGRDGNIQIDHAVRHALVRATFDGPRRHRLVRRALAGASPAQWTTADLVTALERAELDDHPLAPEHVMLELTTERRSSGLLARTPFEPFDRPPLTRDLAERIFEPLGRAGDVVVTFGGTGDPLLHAEFDAFVRMAKTAGVRAVHVRTELTADRPTLDRLLTCGVDVVTVDLHADRATTYQTMMGTDGFKDALANIQYLLDNRRRLTDTDGCNAIAVPWIVPRLRRCAATYEDIDTFFDRWQHLLGTVVLEPPPPFEPTATYPADTLSEAVTPKAVATRERRRRMTIHSDGAVPIGETDLPGARVVGRVGDGPLDELWMRLLDARRELDRTLDPDAPPLRILTP